MAIRPRSASRQRLALVEKLIAIFEARYDEMVTAISTEMGAPYDLSYNAQAECGPGHLKETVKAAREMVWERSLGEPRPCWSTKRSASAR